jgi:hypothetical protein
VIKTGQANGTQATVINVVLKPDVLPQNITLCTTNYTVYAVFASQVSHIVLQHSNDRVQPQTFSLQPRKYTFEASILKPRRLQFKNNDRETVKMKGTQLPVVINNASTGHKLQGTGVDNLFVHDWHYQTNWPYVMLSRVKTKSGLFCRKALKKDLHKYEVPKSLQRMLNRFQHKAPNYFDP